MSKVFHIIFLQLFRSMQISWKFKVKIKNNDKHINSIIVADVAFLCIFPRPHCRRYCNPSKYGNVPLEILIHILKIALWTGVWLYISKIEDRIATKRTLLATYYNQFMHNKLSFDNPNFRILHIWAVAFNQWKFRKWCTKRPHFWQTEF